MVFAKQAGEIKTKAKSNVKIFFIRSSFIKYNEICFQGFILIPKIVFYFLFFDKLFIYLYYQFSKQKVWESLIMDMFFAGIILLFLSGFIANLFKNKHKITVLSVLSFIASILCLTPSFKVLFFETTLSESFNFNEIFGTINFVIDPLSAFFIAVISIMTLASTVYAKGYLTPYIKNGENIFSHTVFLPVLVASMLLVVTCQNALFFLVCWEIMSLSSFFLVIFENKKKEVRRAGIKYLVFMHISVLFIILSFALLSIKAGSYDFASFAEVMSNKTKFANLIFITAFIGFGTKAGFVPFHNWLPAAHPEAPSHVSSMMSGVMIKTGIYGILRILSLMNDFSAQIGLFVLIISVVSALYGLLYAISQHDLKRLLAYSSMENIGIIGIGIGTGMLGVSYNNPTVALLGFMGAILHVLNHSIFKELLFLSAGAVYIKTHTKDVEILGGLIKVMPHTAFLFLIGSVAICGFLPFNGFISEFLIYFGMFKGLQINNFFAFIIIISAIAGLALIGTMAILCFSKAFSVVFLGMPRSKNASEVKDDVSPSMIWPMSFLAVLTFLIGVFPQYIFPYVKNAATTVIPMQVAIDTVLEPLSLMKVIAFYALIFSAVAVFLVVLKFVLTRGKIAKNGTWGCGYNRGNSRMQYSASSYASPFLSMLKPLFKKVFDVEKPRNLFPKSAHFSLHIEDIEEAYILNPLIKGDEKFLSKFESLQSGNIQSYIKYGLLFLVIVTIGSLFIR